MFIGKDLDRIDAVAKVKGSAQFSADMRMEGLLFGCVYRSARPHAIIGRIDLNEALAVPGIVTILKAGDIPGQNLFGAIRKDQPFLAHGKVRYEGEPLLVVVGESEEATRRALGFIKVDYEEIETVLDPFRSETASPLVHETGNLLCYRTLRKGNIERGFNDADVIVERTYKTTWVDHAFMESEAGVGYPDKDGRIVVISSTQNIHYKRLEISRLLALPEERIRVIQAPTGGGFGGKLDVTVEGFLALAVYHTKRPVMMRYTREESFLSNTKRHPLYIEYKTGAKKDGTLTAVKVTIVGDTGAYASYGETVCLRAAVHATGPYQVPHVWVDSRMFYTNNPPSGAMRGFGIPQLAFAHESQLDDIAARMKIDPLDIRLKNALGKGSVTATSQVLNHSAGLPETLRKIEPFWRKRKKLSGITGFGLGCMYYGIGNTGIANPSTVLLELREDGKIGFRMGACEIGQGSDTVLMQILLETLKVERREILFQGRDTDTSKDAGSSSASRQTYITGGAVYGAAVKMRDFLKDAGFYKGKSLNEIYRFAKDEKALIFEGYFNPPATGIDKETAQGVPYATYGFATHMTEVAVEEQTGVCSVRSVYAAHDVGRAINPKMVKGQVYGGVAMGIGFALMEEFVPGKTESFDTYYIPTSMDMPRIEVFIVEDEEPTGPYGAKGVGEPALIPQAASVINALRDATGVAVDQLPCDVERLKILLEKRRK
jgi:nicotinate dehydrogenase large molybdopterin subunit